ncbi:MAG: hypothetical protein A2Y10_16425 [Planctomycetes bacterium GWF2_41_51]|nr:MAG: hypothetical protein A2Y10_16425 [Planctomycetes bacterium GWF2_41_51]HBG27906.1 hypothetical protein [Phycisphaerales bacterium]
MINIVRFILILLFAGFAGAAENHNSIQPVLDYNDMFWMWYPENSAPAVGTSPGTIYMRRTFEINRISEISRAWADIAVDNKCTLYVNAGKCGSANQWQKSSEISIASMLKNGKNQFALEVINTGPGKSAAGIIGGIVVEYNDGSREVFKIDESWKCHNKTAAGWEKEDFDDGNWANAIAVAQFGCASRWSIDSITTPIPADFPEFIIKDNQKYSELLRRLYYFFYGRNTGGTLWDGWVAKSNLWAGGPSTQLVKRNWNKMLSNRKIDDEGYISCHQHEGLAHVDGWPFPLWTQAHGIGWQFSFGALPYRSEFNVFLTTDANGFICKGADSINLNESDGWQIKLLESAASIATPKFEVDSFVAPFICLEADFSKSKISRASMEWTTDESSDSSEEKIIEFEIPPAAKSIMIPAYKNSNWKGKITGLKFNLKGSSEDTIKIRKLFTAVDSRHNINNASYIQGCLDYLNWTGDQVFAKENITKMRKALRYAIEEFEVKKYKCVNTPWQGHDGRSGIAVAPDGSVKTFPGRGIGNNYWDLLPFGGKDTMATIYLYDAIRRFAILEDYIGRNPQLDLGAADKGFEADKLKNLAEEIKENAGKLFWNEKTGRFVSAVDIDGKSYDYGFTFLNTEAVYYGFASKLQAEQIIAWLNGNRSIEDDTSTGEDIYHWRFAPRATTKRNLEYYTFVWPEPHKIAWGEQVQDGGAVLGFSYFDIMSRLKYLGPDNAAQRLESILNWFEDVSSEGGFRAYYSKPGRGSLQGGGTAGGIGIDQEFVESVLLTQAVIEGFMGFSPKLDGFVIKPELPSHWQGLKVSQINWHNLVFDLTADSNTIMIDVKQGDAKEVQIELQTGAYNIVCQSEKGINSEKADVNESNLLKVSLTKNTKVTIKRISADAGNNNG